MVRDSSRPMMSPKLWTIRAAVSGTIIIRYAATKIELPMLAATRVVTSPAHGSGSSPLCWMMP